MCFFAGWYTPFSASALCLVFLSNAKRFPREQQQEDTVGAPIKTTLAATSHEGQYM